MPQNVLAPEEVTELRRLYAQYPIASALGVEALTGPDHILEGMPLKRFLALAENVAAIVRRIREIQRE